MRAGTEGVILKMEYITFNRTVDNKKTQVWNVDLTRTGLPLGVIKWYAPWRQYCFFPEPDTVYSASCMNVIQNFIFTLNRQHINKGIKP